MLVSLHIDKIFKEMRKTLRPKEVNEGNRLGEYLNYLGVYHLPIELVASKWKINVSPLIAKLEKDGFPTLAKALPDLLDECTIQSFYLMQRYKAQSFKNYYPSLPLIDILSKIHVDLSSDMVQDGSQGYFELTHGSVMPPKHWSNSPIGGVLYRVEARGLIIAVEFTGNESGVSFYIPLEAGRNLSDILRDFSFKEVKVGLKGPQIVQTPITEEDITALKLIFNLITYVNNPSEEFTAAYNKLTPKEAKDGKNYTTKPFVALGQSLVDYEYLRATREGTFDVSGHWRWQPCGVGRMNRKLTFIKPHTRTMGR
jgi:hypothetical protein